MYYILYITWKVVRKKASNGYSKKKRIRDGFSGGMEVLEEALASMAHLPASMHASSRIFFHSK
jgi:hypothetical protein